MNYDTFINVLFSRVEGAVVTRALVLANALIFALLALLCMNPMQIPSDLLIRVGGNFAPLVQKDEPWRLFTAMFLHGGLLHVGLNMFALHQAGQGLLAADVGFRHADARLHDQCLGAFAPAGRDGDLDTALRQAIDDVGTDETATPQQQDFLDGHVNPGNSFRKTRILTRIAHSGVRSWRGDW